MKRLSEISREEWQIYKWHEVTPEGAKYRQFVKGKARPRNEMDQAGRDFDAMAPDSLNRRHSDQTKEA